MGCRVVEPELVEAVENSLEFIPDCRQRIFILIGHVSARFQTVSFARLPRRRRS
jgi:hypothetical protein